MHFFNNLIVGFMLINRLLAMIDLVEKTKYPSQFQLFLGTGIGWTHADQSKS